MDRCEQRETRRQETDIATGTSGLAALGPIYLPAPFDYALAKHSGMLLLVRVDRSASFGVKALGSVQGMEMLAVSLARSTFRAPL